MKLVVTQYLSLDGVIEDPAGMEGSGLGNWTGPFSRGPKGDQFKHQELMDAEALLLGRKTYDCFAAVWPTVEEPTGYAARINALPKHVASKTMKDAAWSNSKVIHGEVSAYVHDLKQEGDGDLLVFGSASLVHYLLRHELVDELVLMIYPVVLGRGIKLFPCDWQDRWSLSEKDEFDDGIVLLRYVSV